MSGPFAEMSWEEMEVLEHEHGGLMFPASIRSRDGTGEVKEEPVRVRMPSPAERLEARAESRNWCEKLKIDPKEDSDILRQCEDIIILAKTIRTFEAPHSQFAAPQELAAKYDESSLRDIKERIEYFRAMLDPRDVVRTEEEFWEIVADVKRKKNLLPLADIGGGEAASFIMRLVKEACTSPTAPSSLRSSETSTAGS